MPRTICQVLAAPLYHHGFEDVRGERDKRWQGSPSGIVQLSLLSSMQFFLLLQLTREWGRIFVFMI